MPETSEIEREKGAQWPGLPWLLALLACVAWAPSIFTGGFSFDDREAIFENPVVLGDLPAYVAFERDYWFHRGPAGHYRPLTTLTLRLDHRLHDHVAAGYHASNVLLHALVVLLLALVSKSVVTGMRAESGPTGQAPLGARQLPWIGVALFAVHPVLADSVAWISGRTSMVSALGGLLGAWVLLRSRRPESTALAAGVGLLLALLGKEDGIVFALAYWLLAGDKRRAVVLGCTTSLGLYSWLRYEALGEYFPQARGAPLADASLLERLHAGAFSILEALRLAIAPIRYAPHYRLNDLVPEPSFGTALVAGLAWVAFLLVLLSPLWAAKSRAVCTSAALAACAYLPVAQLVPAGEIFAPRFLYPVLLFGSLAFDAGLRRLLSGARLRGFSFLALLAISVALALAWNRSRVYASRTSYRISVLEQHPDDSRSWNGLGHALYERGNLKSARRAWQHALELDPQYSRPSTNLGISYWESDELARARECFEEAVRRGPRNAIAHVWLGRALQRDSEFEQAIYILENATRLAAGLAPAWNELARAHLAQGDLDAARSAVKRARELAPSSQATLETQAHIDRAER